MSRVLTAKLEIKNLNETIAKKVLEELSKIYRGTVKGLRIEWGTYGFFEVTKDGKITYDTYSAPISFKVFNKFFKQNYNALAVQYALQKAGYRVEMAKQKNKIFVRGVAYG